MQHTYVCSLSNADASVAVLIGTLIAGTTWAALGGLFRKTWQSGPSSHRTFSGHFLANFSTHLRDKFS